MSSKFVCCCALVVLAVISDCGVDGLSDPLLPAIFYPFGMDQGDSVMLANDDGYAPLHGLSVSVGFPFFNTTRHKIFVSTTAVDFFASFHIFQMK